MSPRYPLVQAFSAKLHTVNPALLLAPVAIGSWIAAPMFATSDINTANLPVPIQTAANAVRPLLSGGKMPDTDGTSNSTGGASTIRPAVIASPMVVIPGGGPSGGAGGGNSGGGMSHFGAGSAISPRPALPLPHDKLSSTSAPNLSPPAHTSPPPVHPVAPPVTRTMPVPPPVVVVPTRPPIAHPPVILAPPFRVQPFPFGRPMVGRPFVGGGFARHR